MGAITRAHPVDDPNQRAQLGERMRQLRVERGLRLSDVAALAGLSEPHLSRLERGERWPSLQVLNHLGDIYGVEPSVLLRAPAAPTFVTSHHAEASWCGREESGSGVMKAGAIHVSYDRASRLGLDPTVGASPEAQLGMAIAGSFSMALAGQLESAGFEPRRIDTYAEVQLAASASGHSIAELRLVCEVDAPGLPERTLDEIAQLTKRICAIGRALLAVPFTLQARRVGVTGIRRATRDSERRSSS